MRERPAILALSRDAKDSTARHGSALKHYAAPLFLMMAGCALIEQIGLLYSSYFAVLEFVIIYLSACFALAWQRAALLDFAPAPRVNPVLLRKGEGVYIASLIGLWLICVTCGAAAFIFTGRNCCMRLIMVMPHLPYMVGGAAGIAAFIAATFTVTPLFFTLPPRSLDAPIPLRRARQVSSHLVWPLFAASFLAVILPILLIGAVQFVASFVMVHILGIAADSLPGALAFFLLVSVPVILINFVVTARGVMVLTRLYQWSVGNRPLSVDKGAS